MDKNILVCGNGPSCGEIDFTRVPEDIKVMRMTNFFLEEKYYAGKRVDYYVDYAKRLDNQYFNVRTINDKKEYDIDMENTWWTVLFESNPHFPTVKSCTELIQRTPLIAEFRCFYEYYYGQYLPTGMQAIALAFCLGFNNIYIAGFDLFSDPNKMHVHPESMVSREIVSKLKKTSPYETEKPNFNSMEEKFNHLHKTHPKSMQVDFIKLLIDLFPKSRILSVCESSVINEYVCVAEKIKNQPWYTPIDKASDRTLDWYPLPESMPSKRG